VTYVSTLAALGDGTRRTLLEHLRDRPHAVGELAEVLRVSQPAVSQHLRVLEHARLVTVKAEGRRRIYSMSTEGLTELRRYLESFWDGVLTAFASADPAPPPQVRASPRSRQRITRRGSLP
jgi:DNA-binding transcriptional ArsR family regulator